VDVQHAGQRAVALEGPQDLDFDPSADGPVLDIDVGSRWESRHQVAERGPGRLDVGVWVLRPGQQACEDVGQLGVHEHFPSSH
jgi:hypothetical protein